MDKTAYETENTRDEENLGKLHHEYTFGYSELDAHETAKSKTSKRKNSSETRKHIFTF